MPFITRSIIIIYLIWFCSVAWRATAGNDNGKIHIIFFFLSQFYIGRLSMWSCAIAHRMCVRAYYRNNRHDTHNNAMSAE